jgi:hypothetical protein
MSISSNNDDNLSIVIAIIYFIGGIYSILTGIFALAKVNIKIPGFYQLGIFISNLIFGKAKTSNFEKEMLDENKVIKYAIFWILSGLILLAGGVFLLLVK